MGIKSLECNFNPKTRTYNAHFHFIVPSKEIAEMLIKRMDIALDERSYCPMVARR
jgi:plasmid rolling circle replication initiator protein Rep